ncbi:AAA domain-containing protein [Tabrizicola soli]|uniref:AAA domain-containing protein n=1 Tax=Tabrizicola soli TaxID=2185115 RepID=A0ABV7DVC0_9RHOB
MKATNLDGIPKGTSSKRFSEGVAGLLIDHVRIAFRQDEVNLQSSIHKSNRVREDFLVAKSLLEKSAMTRLERLQAYRTSAEAGYETATAQIRKLEDDRIRIQSLADRWKSNQWTELEIAAAKSIVEAALSDTAHEIEKRDKQIKILRDRAEKLFLEGQECAALRNDSDEIVLILASGGEPEKYQDALAREKHNITAEFQRSAEAIAKTIADRRNEFSSAETELEKLGKELDAARDRASQLDAARHLGWLARRLDPRNLLWRGENEILTDIAAQQERLDIARAAAENFKAKLDELGREHTRELGLLPEAVRRKLIEEARQNISDASTRIAEIERLAGELSVTLDAQRSDFLTLQTRYDNDCQSQLEANLATTIRQAESQIAGIEKEIAAATAQQVRAKKNLTRLAQVIERRRTRLDADLLDWRRQEEGQLEHLEREQRRLRLRLLDRAERAGMVYDSTKNSFREQDNLQSQTHHVRLSYRRKGDGPSPKATQPILLQRRVQTGYEGKDDERLATVLASILGETTPAEDERAALIDRFCDIVFGDDEDERQFFISIISKADKSLLLLVRPALVLPQLRERLPDAMSACVLCRLDYSSKKTPDNTTLFILDAALVPDCEPRPFERTVALVRHSSRTSLPLVASPLDELLDQANASSPTLLDELQGRLSDWQGYLSWASDLILQKAPWAALGPRTWTNDTWEGEVYCEDKNTVRSFSGEGARGDARQSLEVYMLKEAWHRKGREDNPKAYRCIDYKVIGPAQPQPVGMQDCPWTSSLPYRVSMKFSRRDASELSDLPSGTPLGLRDMTEAIGSEVQLSRYRSALAQLQLGATEYRQGNRLPAAPYLMATLFNVAQAAVATAKPGRLLNKEIAKLYRLNEDQGAAVEVMLAAPEIAYVQGPPGTGKTTMIAAACAHFVRSGLRVLIASQTNLAVENALERLIGDPEVRPLWISKSEGEQKKSLAVADWYRMAAKHVEEVCNPFRTLTDEVGRMESWLKRARKLELDRGQAASELKKGEDNLRRLEVRLAEVRRLQAMSSEARARAAWWEMAHDALATLSEWDPSCFSPALASDATELLRLFASVDGKPPRLDVSPRALHSQTQERVRGIQALLSADGAGSLEAEEIRRKILASWPSVVFPPPELLDGENTSSLTPAHLEAAVQRARQSFEDAQSRASEIHAKSQNLLSEMSSIIDLPGAPTDLASGINVVERHADLQRVRLDDTEPLGEWLPQLDRWVIDLRRQAENPPASDRMGERYVRSANVIGVTCNSDFKILSDSGFPRFDVVIIDEVSKATPLELLRPMLLAPKTILVGDHRQLPPTFEFASFGSSDKSPTEDEDQDALEREAELLRKYERLTTASLFRDGFAEIDAGAKAALQTQYRMHPQIMNLVNRFYDGRLESGLIDPDGSDHSSGWSWRMHGLTLNSRTGGKYLVPHLHALWIDSSDDEAGRPAYEDSDGKGIGNKLEARLVAQMVEDILDGCEREQRKKAIAVATFYNRQKNLIRDALKAKLGRRFNDQQIDVETVDRFQGKEADIVIVSMVRNRSRRLGSNSNPAKFERINVAFSRARDLLIVVGARKTFERFDVAIEPVDGGPSQRVCVYGQIIDDIKAIGGLWQAKDILGESTTRSGNRHT